MMVSGDLATLLLQGSRATAFLMGWMALTSGFRYRNPWRIFIFTGILVCYGYLFFAPLGGPGGDPFANPPNPVNIILNILFSMLFWRVSGHGAEIKMFWRRLDD